MRTAYLLFVCGIFVVPSLPVLAREKEAIQYGAGLIVNLPFPEVEVTQVVQEVAQSGIIRGSKEYSKDEYIAGATWASSTRVFPESTEAGKVFYKIKLKALDPQNFKDTNDVGTLAVRYVVQGQDDKHTVLRIDARFLEDYRNRSHASNGSVEGAEYKSVHDRLDAIEALKSGTVGADKEKQELAAKNQKAALVDETPAAAPATVAANTPNQTPPPAATSDAESTPPTPPQTLEQRVQDLRRQVERMVKAPGAPLKSAPFHSAATLQSLPAGVQVLVEIATPYWFGVETHEGQHGWILRDDLELLP